MADYEALQAIILDEYSGFIDSSTVLAILSDYDITDPTQSAAARHILDEIKATVPEDDENGFDPSGTSGLDALLERHESSRGEDESLAGRSQTDATSLSQDLSYLDLADRNLQEDFPTLAQESPDITYTSEFHSLDEEGKEKALLAIFPSLKPFDIRWTLKKCKGDAVLAIDELMFQSFLEESGSRHRGIEAFSSNDSQSRQRKGKQKGRKRKEERPNSPVRTLISEESLQSKWDLGKKDVEFIASRTGMPLQQVSSIYHKNGAATQKTIAAIIEAHLEMKLESNDPDIHIGALELKKYYPSLSITDLEALVQITLPSGANAQELAETLATHHTSTKSPIQLQFRHAPIDLNSELAQPPRASHTPQHSTPRDAASAKEIASSFHQARDTAFTQAASAYRKGKSDPLMSGAAAYYAELGRDLNARAKSAESEAADALVASQSSKTELDLHGVGVKDAVRITRERVTAWWHELGESRLAGRGGVGGAYRVVTGVGNHSEGGKGKLGPAVGKMLIREGWKIEVRSGVLIVTGTLNKRAT